MEEDVGDAVEGHTAQGGPFAQEVEPGDAREHHRAVHGVLGDRCLPGPEDPGKGVSPGVGLLGGVRRGCPGFGGAQRLGEVQGGPVGLGDGQQPLVPGTAGLEGRPVDLVTGGEEFGGDGGGHGGHPWRVADGGQARAELAVVPPHRVLGGARGLAVVPEHVGEGLLQRDASPGEVGDRRPPGGKLDGVLREPGRTQGHGEGDRGAEPQQLSRERLQPAAGRRLEEPEDLVDGGGGAAQGRKPGGRCGSGLRADRHGGPGRLLGPAGPQQPGAQGPGQCGGVRAADGEPFAVVGPGQPGGGAHVVQVLGGGGEELEPLGRQFAEPVSGGGRQRQDVDRRGDGTGGDLRFGHGHRLGDDVRVGAAEAEAAHRCPADRHRGPGARLDRQVEGAVRQVEAGVGPFDAERGDESFAEQDEDLGEPGEAGGRVEVADAPLEGAEGDGAARDPGTAEHLGEGARLDRVADGGAGAVRLDVLDGGGVDRLVDLAEEFHLGVQARGGDAHGGAVVVDGRRVDRAEDQVAVGEGGAQGLQYQGDGAFSGHVTVGPAVEGPAEAVR